MCTKLEWSNSLSFHTFDRPGKATENLKQKLKLPLTLNSCVDVANYSSCSQFSHVKRDENTHQPSQGSKEGQVNRKRKNIHLFSISRNSYFKCSAMLGLPSLLKIRTRKHLYGSTQPKSNFELSVYLCLFLLTMVSSFLAQSSLELLIPHLSLTNNQDYRHAPLCPASFSF